MCVCPVTLGPCNSGSHNDIDDNDDDTYIHNHNNHTIGENTNINGDTHIMLDVH